MSHTSEKRVPLFKENDAVVHRAELLALSLETLEDKIQLAMTCVGFTKDYVAIRNHGTGGANGECLNGSYP
jgi:hypothetical protein